jgi:phosphatidylglycerophosphate synthase
MISIYELKPKLQQLLQPVLALLIKRSFTPNAITILALAGSILVGIILLLWQRPGGLLLLPLWLLIRMALNTIDGMMARQYNMGTPLGCILNELGDVLSDGALYLPLGFIVPESFGVVILFCFGAVMTEFCGVLGHVLAVKRHYEGPMGKSGRAFLIGVLALITVFWGGITIYWKVVFFGAALLTVWTCVNRLRGILKDVTEIC